MINVGIGTTRLILGDEGNKIDGIGVYTKHLTESLITQGQLVTPFAFLGSKQVESQNITALGDFSYQAIFSAMTQAPFINSKKIDKAVDVFHATDHFIPKLHKTPVIATIMDSMTLSHPEWARGRGRKTKAYFFKQSAKWAQQVITISEYSANEINHYFDIPESKISVIPLGVDESCYQKIPDFHKQQVLARYNLPENYFINIGTIQPRKNIQRLIAAHKQLPLLTQEQHPLVLIGTMGWGSEDLKERIKTSEHIYYLDYIPLKDKYALLQSSIALVFPSLYEGFGLPILEAFAANIPVISSKTTSIPEVAGGAALLINPLDECELTDAMYEISLNNKLRIALKIKGLKRAKQFSWAKTAEKTQQVYYKI